MTDYLNHRLPLRIGKGYAVHADLRIPADLTTAEAERLARFLASLADPTAVLEPTTTPPKETPDE